MDIHGIGPAGAVRILADVGDVARFPNRSHFASWTGTAPIDASSGQHIRHRLSGAGNRSLNPRALYGRDHPAAQRHPRPRLLPAPGRRRETSMEAMRCLRRRLSDVVCRQLVAGARAETAAQAGPGGHSGATLLSSAADLPPGIGTSDQPLPGPASKTLSPPPAAVTPAAPTTPARRRCQRAAPHWTNDVDTDKSRRTIGIGGTAPLTSAVIEGSHERAVARRCYFRQPRSPVSTSAGK
jgi:transposase